MNFLCEQTNLEAARSLGRLRRICIYFEACGKADAPSWPSSARLFPQTDRIAYYTSSGPAAT